MTHNPRFDAAERPAKIDEALENIGSWLLGTVKAEPGWNELVLDIKPLSDQIFVRITESRDEKDYVGSIGPLKKDSAVIEDIANLQHAAYDEQEGTWFTATVVVAAKNWPHPDYEIGAAYNRQDEPQDWDGEGRLTARELRAHLAEFPREDNQIPAWGRKLLQGRRFATAEDDSPFEVPNSYLVTALEQVQPERQDAVVIGVLRAMLGGEILMDISDSEFVPAGDQKIGPQSTILLRVLRLTNGLRALCLYSSSEHIYTERQRFGGEGEPVIQRDHAQNVLMNFVNDDSCDVIVVDPATDHECFIEKPQVAWVLNTPHNVATKNALMAGNMQHLLGSLVAPGSVMLMGIRPGTDAPVFVPAPAGEEPDTMMLFTSAAEVAAFDFSLEVRSAPTMEVLKFADQLGAAGVRINALNPSATLPIKQVRELISIVETASVA
ncbi:MAG: SseB family protein [Rothia sp. (in: high G+C Gram-positive bacteria)]|nr:SseB family protein [Rothia sp. (in: high G+C Gram-positive bacteria)]